MRLLRTILQAINRCTGFIFAQGIVGECGTPQDAQYGGQKEGEQTDLSRLSDAELIQRLADQAKELGIEIDLNYRFAEV